MVMDPETLKVIEIGLAIATGEVFLELLVEPAKSWIATKFEGHPKEAIRTAVQNVNNFYGQVNICLDGLQHVEGIEDKKKQALADPDYTSLIQEAVLGAARTNSEQKHKILARLVTDRLTVEPDSLQNLASPMACKAVPQLSNGHLRMLGVLYIIHHQLPPSYIMELSYDERIDIGSNWFLTEIAPLLPIGDMADLDLAHLTAVSCIYYVPQMIHSSIGGSSEPGEWKLPIVVRNKFVSREELYRLPRSVNTPKMDQDQRGRGLLSVWDNSNMRKASLTPAGSLIGLYVKDILGSGDNLPLQSGETYQPTNL